MNDVFDVIMYLALGFGMIWFANQGDIAMTIMYSTLFMMFVIRLNKKPNEPKG